MPAISFPASPSVNDLFTANGKTWQYNGTYWSLVVSSAVIAAGAITSDKLATGAVTADKIADGTIVAAEIATNAITTAKIAAGAVTAAKLGNDISLTPADGSITTAKIAANAITQAKLATNLSAVTVTTTANRDTDIASPFTGQLAILTDTRKIQLYDGTSWVNVSLAPPETPTSLSATALSTTALSIAFTAGGANGSPITNYKYALSTNGGSTYGSFVAADPADFTTPITISGLTAGTTYYIKLKAVNDMGDSVASAAVSIGTLSTPDAPTSLSAGSITATSVAISFTPGSDNGYAITNYQYALSTNSGSTYGSFTALDPADATSPITITGLSSEVAYYVKLKGVNSGGAGAESSAVSFTTALGIDYLVVAGGGGTANWLSGGGGAGGLRSTVTGSGGTPGTVESTLTVALSTNYTVTVGNGGANGSGGGPGYQGGASIFSSITTVGGGSSNPYGSSYSVGGSGGSGAGTSAANTGNGGVGTANQGHAGGNADPHIGSGGGGAGAAGTTGVFGVQSGHGGVGVAVGITGSSVYYAGGGGGGSQAPYFSQTFGNGGNGGGGAGGAGNSNYSPGTSGTANTGGGGGGSNNNNYQSPGGSGGSGIVILRYPNTRTLTLGAGLTASHTNTVDGSYKYTRITAGSGNVSWA